MGLIVFIPVGAIAGFLAGKVKTGSGLALIWDIVVGILGAFLGGWLAGRVGIAVTNIARQQREPAQRADLSLAQEPFCPQTVPAYDAARHAARSVAKGMTRDNADGAFQSSSTDRIYAHDPNERS